jgi:hypothetical protein
MGVIDNKPLAEQRPDGTFKRVISRGRKLPNIKYKEYRYWSDMNTRCNNKNYSDKFPTYKEVHMSDYFKDYNNFVVWCREQPEFFKDNWVLDKDILKPNNKIYHENLCCFVPTQVNSFFTFKKILGSELPIGVSWSESEGMYKSYCALLDGRNKTLGRFDNPDDAFSAYVEYKNRLAKSLADTWEGEVSDRVVNALRNFNVIDYL